MRIGLFIKHEVVSKELEESLIERVKKSGHVFDNDNPQYVFTIGGDGTFLKAVHKYLDKLASVVFVCVNKGKLGYFSDFVIEEFDEVLAKLGSSDYVTNSYNLLKAKMNNEEIFAVNEIRIENPFHTLISEVYVDNNYLETFRGNGLMVCTAIGSTAYNKSLEGAVIDPSLNVMELNEIAPINNRLFTSLKSPIVLSEKHTITFKGDFASVIIGYDYLIKKDYNSNEIEFSISDKKVTLLNKKEHRYIRKLSDSFVRV